MSETTKTFQTGDRVIFLRDVKDGMEGLEATITKVFKNGRYNVKVDANYSKLKDGKPHNWTTLYSIKPEDMVKVSQEEKAIEAGEGVACPGCGEFHGEEEVGCAWFQANR